jgi:hypothetical protein
MMPMVLRRKGSVLEKSKTSAALHTEGRIFLVAPPKVRPSN